MSVFISYARDDRPTVESLQQDLERARAGVWIDRELSGGQAWWDVILGQIRTCDVFVFALSPASLKSRACMAELHYAIALRRPLLPVMVRNVSVQLAPREIADSHIVDYTERTPDAAVSVVTALLGFAQAPPLPDPLPLAPPTPMSYMNPISEQVSAPDLGFQQQTQLVASLRAHLQDDDARAIAIQLLGELRRRPDIVESVGRDIDQLLEEAQAQVPDQATTASGSGATSQPASATSTQPAGWHPDPTGRFAHRFWDGTSWTEHVSSPTGQTVDPIGPTHGATDDRSVAGGTAATATRQRFADGSAGEGGAPGPPAFSGGVYAALIVATVLVGIVGVITGAINMKHPARKGQSQVLLWLGLGMIVLSVLVLSGG